MTTVRDSQVIDTLMFSREGSEIVLGLSDDLDWEDENEHIFSMQEKLNAYLRYIESGEVFDEASE